MAVANKCKVCGNTNPVKWLGKNKNLCSECVEPCPNCQGRGRKFNMLFGEYRCRECRGHGRVHRTTVPSDVTKCEVPK